MRFADRLAALTVKPGTVALTWIGQAGFLLKTDRGQVILVDPCLTDYTYESNKATTGQGFKRLCQPLFEPGELKSDLIFASHEHEDHLDLPAMPELLQDQETVLYCNAPSVKEMASIGLCGTQVRLLRKGDRLTFDGFSLLITDCDHGKNTPDALGFLFDFGFVRVYYSGDTALSPDRLRVPLAARPEVALLPINGEFGNLNSRQAAEYAAMLGSRMCIPHHFFTFALHGGDPRDALSAFPEYAPNCELRFLTPGEFCILS